MRLLFPVIALPLLIPAASPAQAPASPAPVAATPTFPMGDMPVVNPLKQNALKCPPTSRYEAAKRGGKLDMKKLNELPAADGYKAVLREIDGCNAPVMVGYGFGGTQR